MRTQSRPEYAFAYGVEDPQSGNAQSHQEQRDGDKVRGEYKVLEADGSVRTVTYTVDPKNGFQVGYIVDILVFGTLSWLVSVTDLFLCFHSGQCSEV